MNKIWIIIPIGILSLFGLILIPFISDDKQFSGSFQDTCELFDGTWFELEKICEDIEFGECASLGGIYDECGTTTGFLGCQKLCMIP